MSTLISQEEEVINFVQQNKTNRLHCITMYKLQGWDTNCYVSSSSWLHLAPGGSIRKWSGLKHHSDFFARTWCLVLLLCMALKNSGKYWHLKASSCGSSKRPKLTDQNPTRASAVGGTRKEYGVLEWREAPMWANWAWAGEKKVQHQIIAKDGRLARCIKCRAALGQVWEHCQTCAAAPAWIRAQSGSQLLPGYNKPYTAIT